MAFSQQPATDKDPGKGVDERGEPLPGVNVLVKGTQTGVSTDGNGNYSINASQAPYCIQSPELPNRGSNYRSQPVINIKLKSIAKDLDEVVVSYGKQRSREVTGSIVQLSAAPLQDMPVGQFAQQLQGKIAGVTNGEQWPARACMAFRIRGAASLAPTISPCSLSMVCPLQVVSIISTLPRSKHLPY